MVSNNRRHGGEPVTALGNPVALSLSCWTLDIVHLPFPWSLQSTINKATEARAQPQQHPSEAEGSTGQSLRTGGYKSSTLGHC